MAFEIERKFLVKGDYKDSVTKSDHIVQGYIATLGPKTVRIRIRGTGGAYRSAMAMRTGADDYMVAPGTVTCGYTLEKAGRITVGWRARYL